MRGSRVSAMWWVRAPERGETILSVEVCRERFLHELVCLRAQYPGDGVLIGSHEAVVDGDDDLVFGLLIGLVGPDVPVCADALWECVSGFLRDRRRVELFGGAGELRRRERAGYSRYTPPSVRPVVRL